MLSRKEEGEVRRMGTAQSKTNTSSPVTACVYVVGARRSAGEAGVAVVVGVAPAPTNLLPPAHAHSASLTTSRPPNLPACTACRQKEKRRLARARAQERTHWTPEGHHRVVSLWRKERAERG